MDARPHVTIIAIMLGLIIIGGCIEQSVDVTIKRTGKIDLSVSLSADAQYSWLIKSLDEAMQVNPAFMDHYTYDRTETTITHSFRNIDPSDYSELFIMEETDEIDMDLVASSEDLTLTRDTRFPNYHYRLELDVHIEEDPIDISSLISDESGRITPEDHTRLHAIIEEVYDSHSLELVVATRDELYDGFGGYAFDIASDRSTYLIMLVQPDDPDSFFHEPCELDTNVGSDPAFTRFVMELRSELREECDSLTSSDFVAYAERVRDHLDENGLETLPHDEMLGNLLSITYTINTFGEITDTNGRQRSKQQATFSVNPTKSETYYVEWKDNIFRNWLGRIGI